MCSSSVAVVQALLAAYPEATMATNKHGQGWYTPLHCAAHKSSSVAVVQALLAAYPQAAKALNMYGETPADCAAKYNGNAAVKAFFASGQVRPIRVQSEVLRGHQRALRGHSEAIRDTHRPSEGTQRPSLAIIRNQ
jgi:hypothetical protein